MPRPRGLRITTATSTALAQAEVDVPARLPKPTREEIDRLVSTLLKTVNYLDDACIPVGGVVHRAAQMLTALKELTPQSPQGCLNCGKPLPPQVGAGRPRLYCSKACRGS